MICARVRAHGVNCGRGCGCGCGCGWACAIPDGRYNLSVKLSPGPGPPGLFPYPRLPGGTFFVDYESGQGQVLVICQNQTHSRFGTYGRRFKTLSAQNQTKSVRICITKVRHEYLYVRSHDMRELDFFWALQLSGY